jgi:hypothetical protein
MRRGEDGGLQKKMRIHDSWTAKTPRRCAVHASTSARDRRSWQSHVRRRWQTLASPVSRGSWRAQCDVRLGVVIREARPDSLAQQPLRLVRKQTAGHPPHISTFSTRAAAAFTCYYCNLRIPYSLLRSAVFAAGVARALWRFLEFDRADPDT